MAQGRHSNNFDLLRILAAAEVFGMHACEHLKLAFPTTVLGTLPGVPIFFVISGFLVSESYERSSLAGYAVKRALRIFPGLWVCFAVSLGIAGAFGFVSIHAAHFWPWVAGQVTFAPFYNPTWLRGFGVGVLNGSLWTIPVELAFYIALPLLYRMRGSLLVMIALGVIANRLYWAFPSEAVGHKLIGVSLAPWLYMFLLGVFLQRNRRIVERYLIGKLPWWLAGYALLQLALYAAGFAVGGNYIDPVSEIVLAGLVVSAAYAKPMSLPGDFSYGLYLYHMPVINAFVQAGFSGVAAVALAAGAAFTLAGASWALIEKPALSLRRLMPTSRSSRSPPRAYYR